MAATDYVSADMGVIILAAITGADALLTGNYEVALLKSAPEVEGDGSISISGHEVTGGGYTRKAIPVTSFGDPTDNSPVTSTYAGLIEWAPATTEWTVSHVVLIYAGVMMLVRALDVPVTVGVGKKFKLPVGGLKLAVKTV